MVAQSELRELREADLPAAASQQVCFGSQLRDRGIAAPGEPEEERPRSSRSTREGRHTTSTPTGSDREQRLKEEFEEVSGIRNSRLLTPTPWGERRGIPRVVQLPEDVPKPHRILG